MNYCLVRCKYYCGDSKCIQSLLLCRTSNTDISLRLYACHVGAHASLICMRLQKNLSVALWLGLGKDHGQGPKKGYLLYVVEVKNGLFVRKLSWVSFPTLQIMMLRGGYHPDLPSQSVRIWSLLPSEYVGQKQCLTYCNLCKLTVLLVLKYPLLLQIGPLKEHSVVLGLKC